MSILKINIPTSWNNLNSYQLQKVMYILYTVPAGIKQDKAILKALLNVKWYNVKQRGKLKLLLLNVPLSQLREYYQFIFKQNNRTNFLPTIKTKKGVMHGPMPKLLNITAAEFAAADDLHNKWLQTKQPEYLQYLTAILYTPKPRPEFNKLNLHDMAAVFNKTPFKTLLAVHVAYSGSKQHLVKTFKKVFAKGNKQQKAKYGFGKVILEMAKGDLSKHQTIKQVNIYTFLEQFQQDIINAKNKK